MKHTQFLVSLLVAMTVSGCGAAQTETVVPSKTQELATSPGVSLPEPSLRTSVKPTTSDEFIPPTGRGANPPPNSAGERRVMIARSKDGKTFAATGTILSDRANVSDVVVDPDGTVRVYYMGQGIDPRKEENTALALSTDGGTTWSYHKLTYLNFPQPRDPSDPDVVRLEDGTYRMYYTSSVSPSKLGIFYAESPDGMVFTHKGQSIEGPHDAADSTTVYFNGLWHMFFGQEAVQGQLYATSKDGRTFTLAANPQLRLPLGGYYATNGIVEDGTLRMFAFNFQEKNIRAFTTADMIRWEAAGVALEATDETTLSTGYLQDLSVARLKDGDYLMTYVAGL